MTRHRFQLLLASLVVTSLSSGCGVGDSPPDTNGNQADAQLEVCEGIACSDHGTCVGLSGEAVCVCGAGYAGPDCGQCGAGYRDDGSGSCMLDEFCEPESCSGHGTCDDSAGVVVCTCTQSYSGTNCDGCASGYQDNDNTGQCAPDCETAMAQGLTCATHALCDDTSGQAQCVCAPGYDGALCDACAAGFQDNDGDGTCLPDCQAAGSICGLPHSVCDDSAGYALCVCAVGYELLGTACVWSGGPEDPGFQQTQWTAEGDTVVSPGATGRDDAGEGQWPVSATCNSDSIYQQFEMPDYTDAEPLILHTSVRRELISQLSCDDVYLGVEVNGGWHELVYEDGWQDFEICLGERGYGGQVELRFSPLTECSACDGGSPSHVPTFAVDNVYLEPDWANECPALGMVKNGDFEQGVTGWTVRSSGSGSGGIVPGIGVGGSSALRLQTSTECAAASASGTTSIPLSRTVPNTALELVVMGTSGMNMEVLMAGKPLANITGTGARETVRICLTEGFKGLVHDLTFRVDGGGFQCGHPSIQEIVVDDIRIVSDLLCPDPAAVLDPGFENAAAIQTGLAPSWLFGQIGQATGELVIDPATARSGQAALRLAVSSACAVSYAQTSVTVPEPVGSSGPALKFWYRAAPSAGGMLFSSLVNGQLAASSTWVEETVCLSPRDAGKVLLLAFGWVHFASNCTAVFPEEEAWFDDIQMTTDPGCPVP
ncbi:MAG: hypothetical protein ABI333_04770 [bacterium]